MLSAKYRDDLEELRGSLEDICSQNATLLSPISLQLKVVLAMCKKMLNSNLFLLVSDPQSCTRIAECFESVVADLLGFFSLRQSETADNNIQEVQEYPTVPIMCSAIMWLMRRLRLCLYRVDYYSMLLKEEDNKSNKDVDKFSTSAADVEEAGPLRLTTKQMADQLGLELEYSTLVHGCRRSKEEPAKAKEDKEKIRVSDEVLEEYARCYYLQRSKGIHAETTASHSLEEELPQVPRRP